MTEGGSEDNLATDWHIVNAAAQAIRQIAGQDQVHQQIETVVSDARGKDETFNIGAIRRARGNTREARRFSFVRSVDALFAVAGRGGTAQELALAAELGMPLLPVPCFGGTADEFWRAYRGDLIRTLRLDGGTVERWEGPLTDNSQTLSELATEMVTVLLSSLRRRCFVIMPFMQDFLALYDFVIEVAIKNAGDESIRLDRAAVPGGVGGQSQDGIRTCDYVIAVLDGLRPNILYELGLAHAYGKPSVLLSRRGALAEAPVTPFDLAMHQRLEYETVEAGLVDRLQHTITNLSTRR